MDHPESAARVGPGTDPGTQRNGQAAANRMLTVVCVPRGPIDAWTRQVGSSPTASMTVLPSSIGPARASTE